MNQIIQRAFDRGWDTSSWVGGEDEFIVEMIIESYPPDLIFFNHDFAKAYWGSEFIELPLAPGRNLLAWKYHLQQLAISTDRLMYMRESVLS